MSSATWAWLTVATGHSHPWVPNLPTKQINTEAPEMATLPRLFSRLHGGGLITLDCFYHERDSI